MDRNAFVVRLIDRRRRGAPVDGGEPAGIAVGEHVHRLAGLFRCGDRLDQFQAVAPDRGVDLHVLIGDLIRPPVRGGDAILARAVAHRRQHLVQRPLQVDRGRPRGEQERTGAFQRRVGRILAQRQRDAVGRDRADQRCTAHLHRPDRMRGILDGRKPDRDIAMRQPGLIDGADGPIGLDPDRARVLSVDLHVRLAAFS
jgi:hypothetical protein